MKIEVLTTLRGADTWSKGLILDSEKAPLPRDILTEIKYNTGTVRVIEPDPVINEAEAEETVDEAESKEPEIDEVKSDVPEEAEEVGTEDINQEWLCEICGKGGFKSERALRMHKMRAHT